MCDREKIFVSRFVDAFFDRLCRRGGFLGGCAIHGCPSARNCGDCRDTTARRNRRGRGDARPPPLTLCSRRRDSWRPARRCWTTMRYG